MRNDRLWIIRGRGNHYCKLDAGMLSIKCMYNGSVLYETPEGRYRVDDSQYLILNDGQAYSMQKSRDVLSVCVFFPSQRASAILRSFIEPDDSLLDDPFRQNTVNFFETLQHHGDSVSPYMQTIRDMQDVSPIVDATPHEEFLYGLLAAMLQTQRNIARDAEKLPDARLSTRLELFRRLCIARDYLHASYHEDLTIEHLATVAGLSPYHFIRKFKAAFDKTPHQYLRQIRLEKARNLLKNSRHSITEICYAVGFHSPGSFSSLFHKQTGVSPRAYRNSAILEKFPT